jgi:assimilatory nitrate reductase catalytic subunit
LWISALLDAPAADLVIYADPSRGTFRYASVIGQRLDACLFIAGRAAGLPPREALAGLLGTQIEPDMRLSVLAAGRAASNAAGRTICACFGVGLQTLHEIIVRRQLTSIAEIGAVLRAGTNCGSCIPELRTVLKDADGARASL